MTTSPASSASELRERIGANLEAVRRRIAATGRDPNSVRVVAVTKTLSREAVRAAFEVGLRDFGENYVDELCAKRDVAPEGVWHFLGALQTNKIARATTCANVLSGVSRERELTKLASLASTSWLDIQVDFTRRAERNGAPESLVPELVSRARELNLKVRGLMVVAPPDADLARAAFRRTVELADELGLVERSMGMSEDLEMACELGTTEVRVGRALFGPRTDAGHLA
ncbi:MAG TPA: alanine racemase [Acidimicrobiales bacterium]|nr:alanine racemase [Acidimicrobiales bacterium]